MSYILLFLFFLNPLFSAVKGKTPQVGDRVLVEAVYNPNMPFKWNAQRIQTLPQLANQSVRREALFTLVISSHLSQSNKHCNTCCLHIYCEMNEMK